MVFLSFRQRAPELFREGDNLSPSFSKTDKNMVDKYKVITLCGSTKFKEQYLEAQKRLTLEGNIVISVGLFGHSGDDEVWTEGTKATWSAASARQTANG